jgi:hypothetical protein
MNFAMPSMTRSRVACSAGVRCSFGVSLILRSAPTTALVSWSGSAHSAQARPASNSVRGTSASMRSRRSRLAGERGCDSGRCDEKRAKDVLMCVEDVVCGPSCRSNEASRKVEARLSTWVSLTGGPRKKGRGRAESHHRQHLVALELFGRLFRVDPDAVDELIGCGLCKATSAVARARLELLAGRR